MEPIYIPRLTKLPQQTETIDFNETIADLETLTPVQGQLRVTHKGNYLDVSARVETIITLACHRCLQHYNYRLSIAPTELIWLDEAADPDVLEWLDQDVDPEDLVETLSPQGYFEPRTWLYEQLCLEIPQRQLCDETCAGIAIAPPKSTPAVDRRWASLETLKDQLPG